MGQPGVYILQSKKNGLYYIGSTNDIERRLEEHNQGKSASTRNLTPFKLMTFIKCETLTEAKKAEYRFKKYKRRNIIELVIKDSVFPWNHNKKM